MKHRRLRLCRQWKTQEEIDEAGICWTWSDDEGNGVDTSEAWVLSVESNNKPVDA